MSKCYVRSLLLGTTVLRSLCAGAFTYAYIKVAGSLGALALIHPSSLKSVANYGLQENLALGFE